MTIRLADWSSKNLLARSAIYFILLGGFLLRLAFVIQDLALPVRWDEVGYVQLADEILRDISRYTDVARLPLYPLFLAGSFALGGVGRFSIGVTQALVSTIAIALTFALARERFHQKSVALVAALFATLYIEFITLTRIYFTETLFITLLLGALLLLMRAVSPPVPTARLKWLQSSYGLGLGAGILFALAALTREFAGYFSLVVVPIWLLLALPFRRALATALVFWVGMSFVLVPWVVRNYALHQRMILFSTSGEYNLLHDSIRFERQIFGTNSKLSIKTMTRRQLRTKPPEERGSFAMRRMMSIVTQAPLPWLVLRAEEIKQFWEPLSVGNRTMRLQLWEFPPQFNPRLFWVYSPIGLLLLAVVGFLWSRNDAAKLLIWLLVLYTLSVFFLTHYQPRFRVPLLAVIIPDAAFGLVQLFRAVRRPHAWRAAFANTRLYLTIGLIGLFILLVTQNDI